MTQNICTNACTDCRFADWERTAKGKLHPKGRGTCGFVWVPSPMPKSLSETRFQHFPMREMAGGNIWRNSPFTDCPTWQAVTAEPAA